jgi:exosortase
MDSSHKTIELSGVTAARSDRVALRWLLFAILCIFPFVLAADLTRALVAMVLGNDTFSQIPLIPVVSLYLVYSHRKKILANVSFSWLAGGAFIALGLLAVILAKLDIWQLTPANQGSLFVFGIVLFWMGSFALLFGTAAFRFALFPLLFLLFAIPIPEPFLSLIVSFLQHQSANAAEGFFHIAGIPYLRKELIFDLPGVSIQVAEECSGIRSTLALLITTVLAGHLFLETNWRRSVLVLVVVPVAIVKNGLRIAGLSILAVYVNPGFLTGPLHHRGGIVFFMIALVPMALLLIYLERSERQQRELAKDSLSAAQ